MYKAIAFSSKGGHPVNEDSVKLIQDNNRLIAIVADGLGSHGGGDVASAAAIEAIQDALPARGITEPDALLLCLEAANAAVLERQRPGVPMKSTAVVLTAEGGKAAFAHVGDSRGYLFRDGRIASQTMDHSVSQMSVLRGDITPAQIRFHESRSKLLRALGADDKAHGEITPLDAPRSGDAFLLCSDGFWEYVTEDEMEVDLAKAPGVSGWLSLMLARIGTRVPADHDNLSAICVIWGGLK
ncbi:MAG: protein phosphatase 2C domain-containing protein [Oscillospiraceae bacterium]|jgi:serine/threonine protein phosphatase PrpC|nr:protein phosphatase 2C domain-containing protein [Oscillospiraceae bacterium]